MRKSPNYWTKECCREVALKCKSKTEFHIKYISAYNCSWKNKYLDEICSHMKPLGNTHKRLVYSYEFSNNYVYVGITCNEKKRNRDHFNGISPVREHMNRYKLKPIKKILTNGYINVEIASKLEGNYLEKYKNNGWHILNKNKTGGLGGNILYWTKEKCAEAALKCSTRKEFSIKYVSAYISARKNMWLNDICDHMIYKRRPKGYWNYETCKKAALKYSNRFDFSHKCSSAYFISSNNNWLNEFYPIAIKAVFI
jgi:hypothetical protein